MTSDTFCWKNVRTENLKACYWGVEVAKKTREKMKAFIYCSKKAKDHSERIYCELGAYLYFYYQN